MTADLTLAERRVQEAFPRGEVVSFPAAEGDTSVRAEVIRALLLGEASEPGEVAALRVEGARITGLLDLQYGTVAYPIRLMGCLFEQAPILYGAQTRQVNLSESQLPGLTAATIRVDGVMRLTDCRIAGEVRLGGAQISGAFFLDRAQIGSGAGAVLQLNQATVGDDVWAPGLVAHGQVRMNGARIAGALNLEAAQLTNPGGPALDANGLSVGGSVQGQLLATAGSVVLTGAQIGGALSLENSKLSAPGGYPALACGHCTARELRLQHAVPLESSADLRYARFDVINAKPEVWPETIFLDGLSYDALSPQLPAEVRLALLRRDGAGFVPHAYEQLATAYMRIGDDSAARTVRLAKLRRQREKLRRYAKWWGYVQDATVGYGYRPMRAGAWLLGLLAIGTLAYGVSHPNPVEPGRAPEFHPLIYTLDLLLPIIDFGQEKAFNPRGPDQWLSFLLIAAGWILATTIAAGITRSLSRQ